MIIEYLFSKAYKCLLVMINANEFYIISNYCYETI